jgi:hypothetical protein
VAGGALPAGTHTVAAVYTPADSNFLASTSPGLGEKITPDPTTTSVALTALNVSSSDISVSFAATVDNASVAGSGLPTGAVQFEVDGNPVGLPAALAGGVADFVDTAWPAGAHTVTALYTNLDGNFLRSQISIGGGQMAAQAAAYLAGQRQAPAQIAVDLEVALGQGDANVAGILAGLGDNATQIAGALSTAFADPDSVSVAILQALGFGASDIAGALESVYGDTATATAKLFQGAGYPVDAVAQALEAAYQEDGIGVGETLDAAGFTPASIAGALKDVFNWAPNQIAGLFEFVLDLPQSTITAALDQVGFNWAFNPDGSASSTSTTGNSDGTYLVTVIQYDTGLIATGSASTLYDMSGAPLSRVTYDAAGQILTTTGWNYNGDGQPTSEFTIDAAGRVIEADYWYYNADGSLSYSARTDYDSAGRVILAETSDGAGRPTMVERWTYGASGQPAEITRSSLTYSAGGALTQTTDDTWLYNASGTLQFVSEDDVSYNSSGGKSQETEYEWDYTAQGLLAGALIIKDSFNTHGQLTGYTVQEFNAAGIATDWTDYDAQGHVITAGTGSKAGWDLKKTVIV